MGSDAIGEEGELKAGDGGWGDRGGGGGVLVQGMGPTALIQEDKALSQLLPGSEDPGRGRSPWESQVLRCPQQKLTLDLSKKDFMSQLNGKTGDLALKQAGTRELAGGRGGRRAVEVASQQRARTWPL